MLMPKISGSPLLMKVGMISTPQGVPGQKHFITIISDEVPGILRLFTLKGGARFYSRIQDSSVSLYLRPVCQRII
jgi:hypothetical protein